MIKSVSHIADAKSGQALNIGSEGELSVTIHSRPPLKDELYTIPFRQYFTDNGTDSGSNDMRVNGSTTNVEFSIDAIDDYDLYIKTCSVVLADNGATLQNFGALSPLTNGVSLKWVNLRFGESVINDGIKSNIQFYRLTTQQAEIIKLSGAAADAINLMIDFKVLFDSIHGVRLRKGTKDRLVWTVRDNLSTGLDQFDIIGYGFKI